MPADIKRAMSLIAGHQVTPETVARVQAIAHSLEIPMNDAMMPILISLDTYYGVFKDLPKLNQEAAQAAAESAEKQIKGKVDLITSEAIKQVAPSVGKAMSDIAQQVASDVSARDKAIWITGAVAVVALMFGLFGWYVHSTARADGFDSGYATGYSEAKDEKAAAVWANTPEGKIAFKFAQMRELDKLMRCNGRGWETEKQKDGTVYCFPKADNGRILGWRID